MVKKTISSRIKKWSLELLVVALIITGISVWQNRHLLSTEQPAPAATWNDIQGKKISLEAGRKKILYFFAPWCSICKINMGNLNFFAESDSVQTVAVGLGYNTPNELQPAIEKLRVPVAVGSESDARSFRISAFPTIYFLDENNIIRFRVVGYATTLGMWLRAFFS